VPTHVVRPGDCLTNIADAYGFADYRVIYDHPNNAAFKKKRPNPHVIKPGDRIFIPEREPREVDAATGKAHRFRVKRPRAKIHVYVREVGEAFAKKKYEIDVEGETIKGVTDGDGLVEATVPASASEATLRFPADRVTFRLRLGDIDPITEISGVRHRLDNLGYPCRDGDVVDDELTEALRRFQEDRGLDPTGALDDKTRDALKQEHDRGEES
jgi:N-acetylmuramoyl-L-alanine amidase